MNLLVDIRLLKNKKEIYTYFYLHNFIAIIFMEELFFQCPYCWEEISILADPSVSEQTLVEDCEVCCNPIEMKITFDQGVFVSFEPKDLGQ